MKIYSHRINTSKELDLVDVNHGIEIDIRSDAEGLYLAHDPFVGGEKIESFLKHYHHNGLILNVKEEGLEKFIIPLLKEHGIDEYFFLDQSIPFLVKNCDLVNRNSAIRFSEYEPIGSIKFLKQFARWVWIDCFNTFMLNKEDLTYLKKNNLKVCLVSPELQGRQDINEVNNMKMWLQNNKIEVDAVCTKKPRLWKI